jgi:hypothetical protein
VHAASPLAEVGGVCSTCVAMLSLGMRHPGGLMASGGRALPPGCFGAEGFARCVCYCMLPSHIYRRRAGSPGLVVTRWLSGL